MKVQYIFLAVAVVLSLSLFPRSSIAHEVQGITHSHAFKQTDYGQYRVGHSVTSPLGSIIIWSPQTYSGYQAGKTVKFARPKPITKAPSGPTAVSRSQVNPAIDYGKQDPHQE